ncbi:MAG: hypothetical protein GEU77_14510 [Deltaproteobacteria bacterium]|nr:hypothetical protein [Deltaproteobacteria bacterium]
MTRWAVLVLMGFFLPRFVAVSAAQEQLKFEKYRDPEYGYAFQYPADWDLRKLPEGPANDEVRVLVQTPGGNSFMVIVEDQEPNPSKAEFQSDPNRKARVDKLIQQTTQQIYRRVAGNLGAVDSKIGERTDLSNDAAMQFYVSTLHKMKAGAPVIVAGIHSYPFSKSYSISFIMTAFFERGAEKDNATMRAVFNSFQLLDKSENSHGGSGPADQSSKDKSK